MATIEGEIREFLNSDLDAVKVVEVTDGEITLRFGKKKMVALYLNHKLNESIGWPKSFKITSKRS